MSSKEIILVVDDDERICRLLERYLSKQGFEVKSCYSGEGLEKIIADLQPSLLLLDLNLPGEHGFDIAKRVRALDKKIGIIILTGSGDSIDQVVGLEIGADDFVAKPFDERQLLARIRSVLRRVEASTIEAEDDRDTIEIGDITLNLESYEATNKDGSIGVREFFAGMGER